jgi:hypothetical protein
MKNYPTAKAISSHALKEPTKRDRLYDLVVIAPFISWIGDKGDH